MVVVKVLIGRLFAIIIVLKEIFMKTNGKIHVVSFLVALLLVFVLIAYIMQPFVNIIAFAIIIAVLFHPLYKFLLGRVKKPALASLLTVLVILLLIVLPVWLFGQIIFNELSDLFNRYRDGAFVISKDEIVSSLPSEIQTIIQNFSQDLNNFIGRLSSEVFSSVSSVISNIASFVIAFFMFIFIVYYLLKDGGKIKQAIMDISPISSSQENQLIDKIVSAVNGVVKGSFLVALVQGIVATVGFFIFGIPEPWLWGAFTVVAALVPTIGTSISLVPAVIYLAVTGHTPQAIGLAIWGALAVGLIDNLIGPKLIGGSAKLHPVLVLLAVVGGIQFFGFLGFLIGPIIMAIFVAMVEMYREQFKDYINAK